MSRSKHLVSLVIGFLALAALPLTSQALWFNPTADNIFGAAGSVFSLPDDNYFGPIGMGMPFQFFGTAYTDIFLNSNGNLTFTAGRSSWDNYAFPRPGPVRRHHRADYCPVIR